MESEANDSDDEFNFDVEGGKAEENLMNVTVEVQESITRYFSVFGTKTIDFNSDVSPFKQLKDLVGDKKASQMLEIAKKNKNPNAQFKLVLFCMTEGERFSFILNYTNRIGMLVNKEEHKKQSKNEQSTF